MHRIPLVIGSNDVDDNWAIRYDVVSGLLLRDYSVLVADAATMEGRLAEPASHVFALPIPVHLAIYIRSKCLESGQQIRDFGDLVSQLRSLTPEGPMYPSHDELKPSWARWNRTVGPFLRQLGIDNLIAGLVVGDIGMSAKSKLYYSLVHAHEIWTAAKLAYARMGLGEPAPMLLNQIAFGSQVTAKIGHSFTGILPNTLGAKSRRGGIELIDVVWMAICDFGGKIAFPDVADGTNLVLPARPVLSTALDEGLRAFHLPPLESACPTRKLNARSPNCSRIF